MKPVEFIRNIELYKDKHIGYSLWITIKKLLQWEINGEINRIWMPIYYKSRESK